MNILEVTLVRLEGLESYDKYDNSFNLDKILQCHTKDFTEEIMSVNCYPRKNVNFSFQKYESEASE